MKKLIVNCENRTVSSYNEFQESWETCSLYEAGIPDDVFNREEVEERLNEHEEHQIVWEGFFTLEKVLGDKDHKSFIVDAKHLSGLGWDFSGENDAEFFKIEESDFLKVAEVNINVHEDGRTTYLSAIGSNIDWQNADAHAPTGDDAKTLEDVLVLRGKGLIYDL